MRLIPSEHVHVHTAIYSLVSYLLSTAHYSQNKHQLRPIHPPTRSSILPHTMASTTGAFARALRSAPVSSSAFKTFRPRSYTPTPRSHGVYAHREYTSDAGVLASNMLLYVGPVIATFFGGLTYYNVSAETPESWRAARTTAVVKQTEVKSTTVGPSFKITTRSKASSAGDRTNTPTVSSPIASTF